MTLKEVCDELRLSPYTLRVSFGRTQQNLAKRGIILSKWGRGKEAEYFIEYEVMPELEELDDNCGDIGKNGEADKEWHWKQ